MTPSFCWGYSPIGCDAVYFDRYSPNIVTATGTTMRSYLALFHYLITVTLSLQLISIYCSLASCELNLFMLIRERFRGPDSKGDSDDGKWPYHICEKVELIIWLIEGHSVTGN